MSQTISRFLWICAGGAVGTGVRYLLSGWTLLLLGTAFPWGTLAVNVLGSFLVSALMHVALATKMIPPTLRLALTSGVLGGFTTYSTFNYETLEYLREGAASSSTRPANGPSTGNVLSPFQRELPFGMRARSGAAFNFARSSRISAVFTRPARFGSTR